MRVFSSTWFKILFSTCLSAALLTGCSSSGDSVSLERSISDSGQVQEIYLHADDRDLNRLFSRNPRSDDRIRGYVRWEPRGRVQGLNGFRFRGNTSRYHPKKSYNIRFNHTQPILFGGDRMNLNAMYTDPSAMREKLAWDMFHKLEQPASQTRYAALYINDIYEGLGIHVQRIDELLLSQHGLDPNGTLVRDLTRRRGERAGLQRQSIFGFDLSTHRDSQELLAAMFDSRWAPDRQELHRLVKWVHDIPAGDKFEEKFRNEFDTANFIDWLAIHYLIGDADAFGDDYWLYRGRSSGSKWKILPWDHDLSFGRNERDGLRENPEFGQTGRGLVQLNDFFAYEYPLDDSGWDNALIIKFHESPGLRREFEERMLYLMDKVFTPEYFQDEIDRQKAKIQPWMDKSLENGHFKRHQRQHHGEAGRWDAHLENLLDFVQLRYSFIRAQLTGTFAENEAYTTAVELSENHTGQKILLTDKTGWTVAAFTAAEITGNPKVQIKTREIEESGKPFNKKWEMSVTGGTADGRLTLFYRNDIAPDGKENWYHLPEAIGNQWNLHMLAGGTPLESTVNAFSNKISADISLQDSIELRLDYRE